jgi:hypothetical protein
LNGGLGKCVVIGHNSGSATPVEAVLARTLRPAASSGGKSDRPVLCERGSESIPLI